MPPSSIIVATYAGEQVLNRMWKAHEMLIRALGLLWHRPDSFALLAAPDAPPHFVLTQQIHERHQSRRRVDERSLLPGTKVVLRTSWQRTGVPQCRLRRCDILAGKV